MRLFKQANSSLRDTADDEMCDDKLGDRGLEAPVDEDKVEELRDSGSVISGCRSFVRNCGETTAVAMLAGERSVGSASELVIQ